MWGLAIKVVFLGGCETTAVLCQTSFLEVAFFLWKYFNIKIDDNRNIFDDILKAVVLPGHQQHSFHCYEYWDLEHLDDDIKEYLRLASSLDITGTYKLKKRELQSEGSDPSKISDPLFLLHPKTRFQILHLEPFIYQFVVGPMCLWIVPCTRIWKKVRFGCESKGLEVLGIPWSPWSPWTP